jgi:CheY-like chemotaxis protein
VPRILVIEDDSAIRGLLVRMLSASGHSVSAAPNGAEALRLWRDGDVDLVLTDLQMPEMNGIEVILQLRAFAPSVPVIAMSGGDRSRDLGLLGDAQLLGAVGLLQKPFTGDALLAAIAAAMDPRNRRQA